MNWIVAMIAAQIATGLLGLFMGISVGKATARREVRSAVAGSDLVLFEKVNTYSSSSDYVLIDTLNGIESPKLTTRLEERLYFALYTALHRCRPR